ncbi:complement C3-like [Menidia menidia]
MGSSRRMPWIQMLLWGGLLAFAFMISPATAGIKLMSAPNLMRVGIEENIFVEIQHCEHQHDINVEIMVKNHPTKRKTLKSTTVTLRKADNYQGVGRLTVPTEEFSNDVNAKQYVYIQAQFPDALLEKVVMISFQSGYIFIQTDKTIYTPATSVRYRVFALRPSLEPVARDAQQSSDTSVLIEIETPAGIVIKSNKYSMTSGIYTGAYTLPEIVSMGQWKVVAKFENNPQQSFFSEFEVKEYVLPSFEVKLSTPPESPFFNVESDSLTITIKASYVFGEDVEGSAYVVFGLIGEGKKRSFPGSLQRVLINRGKGSAILRKVDITQTFPNINELVGKSIYVTVNVLTESGGEMVETELRSIKIVTSPYTITFKRTSKYFKPGMSFDVAVEVVNPDDSPAKGIPVIINPGGVSAVTRDNGLARLTINTVSNADRLSITAETTHPGLSPSRQARASMDAYPYKSQSNSFLHINVDTAEVALGDDMKILFFISWPDNQPKDITYLVLSRGQIVQNYRYVNKGLQQISRSIRITKEMLPSFRIVAYCHSNSGELVSDSVWIDVKDSCMGTLKLETVKPARSYEPGQSFDLKITGDPGATVGLVAVDKSVYVLNRKNQLTLKKIWDTVEKYDPGCTSGGGKDNMHVLYDAGLILQTSTGSGTPSRTELSCPSPSRRRRAITIMDVRTSLLSKYEDQEQRECCLDGMREVPVSYSCKRRTEYIVDGKNCENAFLFCCEEMQKHQDAKKDEVLHLARSEENDGYLGKSEIRSRSYFPESWHWTDVKLEACPSGSHSCGTKTFEQRVYVPESITTWELTGISLSKTHSICIAEPLEVVVWQQFFIDLRLPYSAVRGEQLEIKAILHNYKSEAITVRVELKEEKHVCSGAFKKNWFVEEVIVGAETTRSVPFIIIPMTLGEVPIEIKASVKYGQYGDGIKKMLRVVSPGVLVRSEKSVKLEPGRRGGTQVEVIRSDISTGDMVPNTPSNTLVSVTGREQMSTLLEHAISGESMGNLIRQPAGCGEQNMIQLTLPVIATVYLDKTNQWELVGFERRNEALQHMATGYQTELTFRKNDGSFTIFQHCKSTTWLTAYVAKVFAMAYDFAIIKVEIICEAIKFMILRTQQPDGQFVEIGDVYHKEMIGDVGGLDTDASMTAFVLIAMQESESLCSSTVGSMRNAISKATTYLERRLPHLTNPYSVAMTSYALAKANKMKKEILFKFASQDRTHWPVAKGDIFTLEATAYALLALVNVKAYAEAKPIVRWLSEQKKGGGEYGSTQATIMVYQAVAEYWANANEPAYKLSVDMKLPGKNLIDKYSFDNNNHYTTRTSKFQGINKDIELTAKGTGEGMFNMVSLYYAMPKTQKKDCERFHLAVELIPDTITEEKSIYKLKIEFYYKHKERNASMSILDIGLPTAYIFNKNDLDALSKGRDRLISKYEMNNALSERGSLIIYLDKVSNSRPEEISFRIERVMKVGVLQPAAVSIYEYYDKKHCVEFYRPERKSGALEKRCTDDACICAEESCSRQKKDDIRNEDRTKKACESTSTSKIDFVYKVQVEHYEDALSVDVYNMRILNAFKEGSTDVGPKDQLRKFLVPQHCSKALDLQTDKTYLIMGSSSDIYIHENQNQYIVGEKTWVEYWPTGPECQDPQYRPTCKGMEHLVEQFELFGCQL